MLFALICVRAIASTSDPTEIVTKGGKTYRGSVVRDDANTVTVSGTSGTEVIIDRIEIDRMTIGGTAVNRNALVGGRWQHGLIVELGGPAGPNDTPRPLIGLHYTGIRRGDGVVSWAFTAGYSRPNGPLPGEMFPLIASLLIGRSACLELGAGAVAWRISDYDARGAYAVAGAGFRYAPRDHGGFQFRMVAYFAQRADPHAESRWIQASFGMSLGFTLGRL